MEYNKEKKEIILDRELSNLDKFVIDFCGKLKEYVIVSGYVSILLGRSRATEDVDLLIPKTNFNEFLEIWNNLREFECINTSNPKEAFEMLNEHAIRFFRKNPVPNIEFKFIKNDLDKYSFENKIKVILGEKKVYISPIELQIAYKLFLAADIIDEEFEADKNIEDAKHLYQAFKGKINKEELLGFVKKLNVIERIKFLE